MPIAKWRAKGYDIEIGAFVPKAAGYPVTVSMEPAGISIGSVRYAGIVRTFNTTPTADQASFGRMALECADFSVYVQKNEDWTVTVPSFWHGWHHPMPSDVVYAIKSFTKENFPAEEFAKR